MKIFNHKNEKIFLTISPENEVEKDFSSLVSFVELQREAIFSHLHENGALLFRGFNIDNVTHFEFLASNLGISFSSYQGGDSPRDKINKNIYTSTNYPAHLSISLHNELSFSNSYPQYLMFYCSIPSLEGGETPIANGETILNSLSAELIETFKEKKVKYIMNLHDGYGPGKSWKECFETDRVEEIERILAKKHSYYKWGDNYSSLRIEEIVNPIIRHPVSNKEVFFSQADQWHPSNLDPETYNSLKEFMSEEDFFHNCTFGDNSEIPLAFLDEIREKVLASSIAFPWEKNDVLFIDNILTLHGRTPYKGERKVYVCMGNARV